MPQSFSCLCAAAAAVIALATPAFAQDDPKFALITSVPAANAGFQWQLNNRVAIRIDGTFNSSSETQDYVSIPQQGLGGGLVFPEERIHVESTTRSTTINLSGIITLRQMERIRLYVAPRVQFGFSRQHLIEETEVVVPPVPSFGTVVILGLNDSGTNEIDQSSTTIGGGGSFGAAGKINDALALFAEFGLTYAHSDAPNTIGLLVSASRSNIDTSRNAINTRAIVGVMFLF